MQKSADLLSSTSHIVPPPADTPPKGEKKAIRKAKFEERRRIYDLVAQNSEKIGEGIVRYLHDLDDLKIAKLVAPDLNERHVAGIRVEFFGRLRTHNSAGGLEARILRLEGAFNALAEEVGATTRV